METVWMYHPDLDVTVEVPAGAVGALIRQGWEVVPEPEDDAIPDPPAEGTIHSIGAAGVSDYITRAELAADPAFAAVTVPAASTTVPGRVELATDAESVTGADAARANTPASTKAQLLATAVTVVAHGATAATARPTGAASVLWIGNVEPTNADDLKDLWLDTSA